MFALVPGLIPYRPEVKCVFMAYFLHIISKNYMAAKCNIINKQHNVAATGLLSILFNNNIDFIFVHTLVC